MRPVDKGITPKVYTNYGDARHDLAKVIGYYCSYCEMNVSNSIEVEHILPQNQGGAKLDWNNFLLSCKYCNTIKSDNNDNSTDYLWPDIDNTDLAFKYSEDNVIKPKDNISSSLKTLVKNTINLIGLDRTPGGNHKPTEADTRWRSRKEAWDKAKRSYKKWLEAPIKPMAESIAISSRNGHYSIWCEVFKDQPIVLQEIDKEYREMGLFKKFKIDGTRLIRSGGRI